MIKYFSVHYTDLSRCLQTDQLFTRSGDTHSFERRLGYIIVLMKQVTLEVITSPGCAPCHDFLEYWKGAAPEWQHVIFTEYSLATPEGLALAGKHRIFAVPGVIVNGVLFASGVIDTGSLAATINDLSV